MKKFLGEFYKGLDDKEYFYLPMLKSIYHIPKQDLARFNAFRQRLVIVKLFISNFILCVIYDCLFQKCITKISCKKTSFDGGI